MTFQGEDIYDKEVDAIEVRRRIGMVFQKPNPFPKSIYDNIAYGPRVIGMKASNMDDLVEEALTRAALWTEVKDKLKQSAFGLSGGQLSIRLSGPHPIVRLSPIDRAEEHQWWCGSAPQMLPVTDYAVARAACSLML